MTYWRNAAGWPAPQQLRFSPQGNISYIKEQKQDMSPVCGSGPSLIINTCGLGAWAEHTYFLAPGGCRPGSGPLAQQSLDTLEKKTTKGQRFSLIYKLLYVSIKLRLMSSPFHLNPAFVGSDVNHLAYLPTNTTRKHDLNVTPPPGTGN